MKRLTLLLAFNVFTLMVFASAALADAENDHGEGWYGETNDVAITKAGFILIAGFPLFILLASLAYHYLDNKRMARLKAEKTRLQRADARGGW